MATFWDPATRDEVCRRVERLTLDHKPEWGKMNVAQMLAHLNDALRMATGDLATTPKNTPLRRWPIKQLIVYVLPWPKGAPTAPELLARVDSGRFRRRADCVSYQSSSSWQRNPQPTVGPNIRRSVR